MSGSPSAGPSSSRSASASASPPASAPATVGWKLNETNTGLAALGLTCDALPLYKGSSRPAAGTKISGMRIETTLDLSLGDITVERSCIRPPSGAKAIVMTTDFIKCKDGCQAPKQVFFRNNDVDATRIPMSAEHARACAFLGAGIVEGNRMFGMGSGICFYNAGRDHDAIARGNYVHQLRTDGDAHHEAATVRDFVTSSNPNRRAVFEGNRLDSSTGRDSAALFMQAGKHSDDIDNVLVTGNLLEGKAFYQLWLEAADGKKYGKNMRATNNRFAGSGKVSLQRNGIAYGWAEWSGNHVNDPKQPDNRGAVVSAP